MYLMFHTCTRMFLKKENRPEQIEKKKRDELFV